MSFPGIAEGFVDQGAWSPEDLIAGSFPRVMRIATIQSTDPLPSGSVLGRIDASDIYTLSQSAASDGSQLPDAILAEAIEGGA